MRVLLLVLMSVFFLLFSVYYQGKGKDRLNIELEGRKAANSKAMISIQNFDSLYASLDDAEEVQDRVIEKIDYEVDKEVERQEREEIKREKGEKKSCGSSDA